MRRSILLDTHFFVWLRSNPNLLTNKERQVIDDAPLRYVSAVSFWEISILISLGRIPGDARMLSLSAGLELLPLEPRHCLELTRLPQRHRDPFDRMLMAQARRDDLVLVTRDEKILAYGRDGAVCANLI